MANRHDANQVAAEQLAEQVGSFPFSFGPARTIAVTEGMLTAAFRRALDAGLIAVAPGCRDCISCGESCPRNECPKSKAPCGHHCNHAWTGDICHWCDAEFGEEPDDDDGS